jgi:hypothetical protein
MPVWEIFTLGFLYLSIDDRMQSLGIFSDMLRTLRYVEQDISYNLEPCIVIKNCPIQKKNRICTLLKLHLNYGVHLWKKFHCFIATPIFLLHPDCS